MFNTNNFFDNFDDDFNNNEQQLLPDIHLGYKKRNKRKGLTTIEGLRAHEIDIKQFYKKLKKKLCCSGFVSKIKNKDEKEIEIVQFQGDHRVEIKDHLMVKYKISKGNIIVHGA